MNISGKFMDIQVCRNKRKFKSNKIETEYEARGEYGPISVQFGSILKLHKHKQHKQHIFI